MDVRAMGSARRTTAKTWGQRRGEGPYWEVCFRATYRGRRAERWGSRRGCGDISASLGSWCVWLARVLRLQTQQRGGGSGEERAGVRVLCRGAERDGAVRPAGMCLCPCLSKKTLTKEGGRAVEGRMKQLRRFLNRTRGEREAVVARSRRRRETVLYAAARS